MNQNKFYFYFVSAVNDGLAMIETNTKRGLSGI